MSTIASEVVETVVRAPRKKPTKIANFFRSLLIPGRVCGNCCIQPCVRTAHGRRRPSWNYRMQLAVSTLRTASKSIPRDPKQLRFWVDHAIPDVALPLGAVRYSNKIGHLTVEYVWPRHLSSTWGVVGKRSRATKHELTPATLLEWSKTHAVVLYFHGGAYMLCSSATHRGMVYSLVTDGDFVAVVPNYRRVPEVSVVEAVDDCFSIYQYLVQTVGISPSRIAIMGDSAGGALSVLTLARIRDMHDPTITLPSCGILLSPWVDLDDKDIQRQSLTKTMPEFDYLPLDAIVIIAGEAIRDMDPRDPRINPMHCDLTGFPPLLVHAGEIEVLRPQIERFVALINTTQVDCTYEVLDDMIHVGHMFSTFSEIARQANKRVGLFVAKHIVGGKTEPPDVIPDGVIELPGGVPPALAN